MMKNVGIENSRQGHCREKAVPLIQVKSRTHLSTFQSILKFIMHSQRIHAFQLRTFPLDDSDDETDCSPLVATFKHLHKHLQNHSPQQLQSSHLLKLHLVECARQLERHRSSMQFLRNEKGLILKQLEEKRRCEGYQIYEELLDQVMQDLTVIDEASPELESLVNRQRQQLQQVQRTHQTELHTALRQMAQSQFRMLDLDLQFIAQKLGLISTGVSHSKQNLCQVNIKKKQSGNLDRMRTQKQILKNPSRPELYKHQMEGLGLAYELKQMKKLIEKVRKPSKAYLLKTQI